MTLFAKAVETMAESSFETSLVMIRDLFKKAQHGPICDCPNPRHRFKVRDAGDWEAVDNLMHTVMVLYMDSAQDVIKLLQRNLAQVALNEESGGATMFDALEAIAKTAEFNAMGEILAAHDTLRDRGAMTMRNADLYYDQIIGICEEHIQRRKKDGPKAGGSNRQDPSGGSGNSGDKQAAHGTEASTSEAGRQTTEELRQRRH